MQRFLMMRSQPVTQFPVSPFTQLFFFNTKLSWLWLIIRLYIGYEWLSSGATKLFGYSFTFGSLGQPVKGGSWLVGGHGVTSLTAFFQYSLSLTGGLNPAVQSWYAAFLQHIALPNVAVFAYLIPFGETLVGLGLIFGAFTGIAACFGVLMNVNYLFAGSISSNPILLILEIVLILAWRIAGFYGLDYFLLPQFRIAQPVTDRSKSKKRIASNLAEVISPEKAVS